MVREALAAAAEQVRRPPAKAAIEAGSSQRADTQPPATAPPGQIAEPAARDPIAASERTMTSPSRPAVAPPEAGSPGPRRDRIWIAAGLVAAAMIAVALWSRTDGVEPAVAPPARATSNEVRPAASDLGPVRETAAVDAGVAPIPEPPATVAPEPAPRPRRHRPRSRRDRVRAPAAPAPAPDAAPEDRFIRPPVE
jgi:hypothetical protein